MNKIKKLYQDLSKKYGKPQGQWKLWCQRPKTKKEKEEIIIGAILTQRTNWNNVEMAIHNLKKIGACSLQGISKLGQKKLPPLVKPSGFYCQKAERLLGLAKFILKNYQSVEKMQKVNASKLRKELLNLKGIGPETADSILLYALGKPVFVIDEYTKRLVKKYKIAHQFSYEHLQKLFANNLKKDYRLYQDFHALIIIAGKTLPG